MTQGNAQLTSLSEIADAATNNFVELILLSGLDPSRHLRFANWSGVDFSRCDLRGYDFTGARLYGCKFDGALINGARFDHAEMNSSDLSNAKDWDAYYQNYLRENQHGRPFTTDEDLIPEWLIIRQVDRHPVLPLRDIVLFPHMIVPFYVKRKKSIQALDEVMLTDKQILLVAQKNADDDEPELDAIYSMGTLASVLQLLKLPTGEVKVMVEGTSRAMIKRYTENEAFFEAEIGGVKETIGARDEIEELSRSTVAQFERYGKLNKKISPEFLEVVSAIDDCSKLADTIASYLTMTTSEKQELLEITAISERLKCVYLQMESEISALQVEAKILNRAKRQMEKTQRQYYVNEPIRKELDDGDNRDDIAGRVERHPMLPLRDVVLFPYMIVSLLMGRQKSINAIDEVMRTNKQILLVAQANAGDDASELDTIYSVGTLASVLQVHNLPDGTVKVLVEGTARARIKRYMENEAFLEAKIERVEETIGAPDEIEALSRLTTAQFESYAKFNKKISREVLRTILEIDDYSKLADTIASHLAIKIAEKQEILEITAISERLECVYLQMGREIPLSPAGQEKARDRKQTRRRRSWEA